ncbi:MAG TPA: UDP-glucose/GDP-mannose dehydrogenase family protein, partial [Bryobacteraceae bacterium]|nr:UDP-glucose/GDP-mannose dehydrogenase family protein [Bryobacteraceae bacterium]
EFLETLAAEADALVLVTDWPEYRNLPWSALAKLMRTPLVVDGRNFLERDVLERAGFRYLGMGR